MAEKHGGVTSHLQGLSQHNMQSKPPVNFGTVSGSYVNVPLNCFNIGTSKTINFPFGTNGKLMLLGVPALKHFRIFTI